MRFVCLNLLCVSNVVCVFAHVGNHETTAESSSSVLGAYFPARDAMGAARRSQDQFNENILMIQTILLKWNFHLARSVIISLKDEVSLPRSYQLVFPTKNMYIYVE